MGFSHFHVKIHPDPKIFFPGQVVRGSVQATASSSIRCRSVKIIFKGKAKTFCNEKEKYETLSEKYFYEEKDLFAVENDDTVGAGDYVWPFEFTLPQNIPSSFEGMYGYVRYNLKAQADIPLGFNNTSIVYFSVNDVADLNHNDEAKQPMSVQKTDTTGFWSCSKGPVHLNFNCPRSGAVVGEGFKIRGEVVNEGSKCVEGTSVTLKQVVKYKFRITSWRGSYKVAEIRRGRIDPGGRDVYEDDPLTIQAVVPNLRNCNIIDLEYRLTFKASFGSCASVSDEGILHIGTVPFIPQRAGDENGDAPYPKSYRPSMVSPPNQHINSVIFGLRGTPSVRQCYLCSTRGRRDRKSPPPKYLSFSGLL